MNQQAIGLSSRTPFSQRIPELDGIRGLAILMVLAWHYVGAILSRESGAIADCTAAWLTLTWGGVDLFFVLSGFLIGGILLDQRGKPGYFVAFYARRCCRILPPYVLLLTTFVILNAILTPAFSGQLGWLFQGSMPLWSYVLYVQNFAMADTGRFGANAIAITWSLAVEEQFYLLLPLAILLFSRSKLRSLLPILILAAPLVRFVLSLTVWPGWFAGYAVCRWDSLLLGVLGAVIVREDSSRAWLMSHPRILRWTLLSFALSAALMLYLGLGRYNSFTMNTLGYTWLGFGSLVLLLAGVLRSSLRLSRWLRASWLRKLGMLSYGVYLYHQLLLGLCHGLVLGQSPKIRNLGDGLVTVMALGLTLTFAALSWELMEKWFVAKGRTVTYETVPSFSISPRRFTGILAPIHDLGTSTSKAGPRRTRPTLDPTGRSVASIGRQG